MGQQREEARTRLSRGAVAGVIAGLVVQTGPNSSRRGVEYRGDERPQPESDRADHRRHPWVKRNAPAQPAVAALVEMSPVQRMGRPDEVTSVVRFLLSDQ